MVGYRSTVLHKVAGKVYPAFTVEEMASFLCAYIDSQIKHVI